MPIQKRRRFLTDATFACAAGLSGFGASGKSRTAALQTRRRFLGTAALAGAAGMLPLLGARAAEPGPETTTVRFGKNAAICVAPQYYLQALLRAEGFTEIVYVETPADKSLGPIAHGTADFTLSFALGQILAIDGGAPMTVLAGVHVGCYQLFARDSIHSVGDLKGKSVGLQTASPALLKLMALQVGLDPTNDIRWVTDRAARPLDLFAAGKIDAFLGFPPEPQELRARNAGQVIVDTALDLPWSQYFCCMLAGSRDYVEKHPVATKRVLRAILKATDLCVSAPAGVARRLVESGFTPRYDYALQTLRDSRYEVWREYDAEDTMRFYALRLYEAGLIKTNPNKIIAGGTDWRFLNELKRELKA